MIRFVAVRGKHYRASTFYAILCGLNRVLQKRSDEEYNLFKHPRFLPFRRVFDGYLKEVQATEIIETYKSASLEVNDEEKIEAILGCETAAQLLVSLIYKTTYTWALRGGTILSHLTIDNFAFHEEDDCIRVGHNGRRRIA